jgi:hypothetical protein
MKRLISWILGHSNARMVLAARERRRAALEPLQSAIRARATRDIGERFPAAREATNELLRMELGR